MATAPHCPSARKIDYRTGDGKPMAENEIHRDDMMDLIQSLQDYFADEPMVCVSGNMLIPVRPNPRLSQAASPGFSTGREGVYSNRAGGRTAAERGSGPTSRARWPGAPVV